MISALWRSKFHNYLGGVVRGLGGVPEGIGGIADHVHLLVSLRASHCVADFVREIKKSSSLWIRETEGQGKFKWQEGYAAFTVSASALKRVQAYIAGQETRHKKKTFREELIEFLTRSGIQFDEQYLD